MTPPWAPIGTNWSNWPKFSVGLRLALHGTHVNGVSFSVALRLALHGTHVNEVSFSIHVHWECI
jgi:hypothetical protein